MMTRLNFAARFATAAGLGGEFPLTTRNIGPMDVHPFSFDSLTVLRTITRHGQCDSRMFFTHAFHAGKQKGVRDGPFLEEGGKNSNGAILIYDRLKPRHKINSLPDLSILYQI